ncbi:MAG: 6-phosphogluconolactonase [Patescibacteria group bacterium]|nr:6-phosphogluconolactonase [Patescibacteria group bacterium]
MNDKIKQIENIEDVVNYVSSVINEKLQLGRNVLWFVSGGSAISLEVAIAKRINVFEANKLAVTLADERFVKINDPESNWFKLIKAGFSIKDAKFIPFLKGKSFTETTNSIKEVLEVELNNAQYKIGIFGIGADGHTAGILPHSKAINSKDIICNYETDLYNRITITPKTISMLDEAIISAVGESKWKVIKDLEHSIPVNDMPAQILKQIPLLTIFTDFKNNI